jgi:ribosomal protection tetracycline resistance protein
MSADSILLEPWYDFRLEIPSEYVGRAMSDFQQMSGKVSQPEPFGEGVVLTGSAPVAEMRDYSMDVTAYTRGRGRLFCTLKGFEPCHNQNEVVAAIGYDSERDTENPADSVFCAHGAGFTVKWDQVRKQMHVDSGLKLGEEAEVGAGQKNASADMRRPTDFVGMMERDEELKAIFERTYGPVKPKNPPPREYRRREASNLMKKYTVQPRRTGPEYLLVDGYNIIFDWDELKTVAKDNLGAARNLLMDILSNYQGFRKCVVILVFDAYKVPHNSGETARYHNIHVVFTKEAETADAYIEKVTDEIGKKHLVTVATSDGAEQLIILSHGALRLSARAFRTEVKQIEGQIAAILARNNRRGQLPVFHASLVKARNKNQDQKKECTGPEGSVH